MFCGKKYARLVCREGFTLVELLIVIVVIGVLSAMMMLSSTEAVSSARVSNIISNLRNLKTAALAYYTDNLDTYSTIPADGTLNDTTIKEAIFKYLSSAHSISEGDYQYYNFYNKGDKWFVFYGNNNDANLMTDSIRQKLLARVSSLGLLSGSIMGGASSESAYDNISHKWYVGMRIR